MDLREKNQILGIGLWISGIIIISSIPVINDRANNDAQ